MSGSPVFLTSGKVAILNAEGATFANQGNNMQSIIEDVMHHFPCSGKDGGGGEANIHRVGAERLRYRHLHLQGSHLHLLKVPED